MAIYQPNEMDFTNNKFSMIIYGSPGIGKTTLAFSAPNPLLIDFDKGLSRVKAQHRKATSIIGNYEELLEDMKTEAFKQSETIIIDTGGSFITYLQDWAMRKDSVNRQKSGGISMKGFGAVKSEFIRFTNELKTIHNKNIIYIFHSQEEKDKDGNIIQRLMCEGSARNIVWQPCDLGAFIQMRNGQRVLGFTPTDEYFAKGCHGIHGLRNIPELSENSKNDFLTLIFEEARKNISSESKIFEVEKEQYEKVMKEGMLLINEVIDLETAEAFADKFKNLSKHSLTSEKEIKSAFSSKLKQLNIYYDVEVKEYKLQEKK